MPNGRPKIWRSVDTSSDDDHHNDHDDDHDDDEDEYVQVDEYDEAHNMHKIKKIWIWIEV